VSPATGQANSGVSFGASGIQVNGISQQSTAKSFGGIFDPRVTELSVNFLLPGAPVVGTVTRGSVTALKEILKRFGTSPESVARLTLQAGKAETQIGIHGVSVTAREVTKDVSTAVRTDVEKHLTVHNTGSAKDPLHRTVELPKPVTQEVADLFNTLFGRTK
jgi:hypothetical protein